MYECVHNNVPFSLAGSIRDDGPLPDTQMDLIKAQSEYAKLLEGTDMILMLSSMLHSIGVGNMTPAGVKMVCVDINPAVVTKLSDRGSVESVGVVTDVGLFLSLLVQQLDKLTSLEQKIEEKLCKVATLHEGQCADAKFYPRLYQTSIASTFVVAWETPLLNLRSRVLVD
jgi:hypothetical protein